MNVLEERWVLALSGGAARGFAFVGVMKALEEMGFPIGGIVGCSAGALVGGLYAAGVSPEAMEEALARMGPLDWASMFRPTLPFQGITDGKPVLQLLRDLVGGNPLIEDLAIPFRAVATDLHTGEVVVLDRGPLLEAIRASIAIPGLFTPLVHNGRVLVDGGLVEPIPIPAARRSFRDPILAVNVLSPLPLRHVSPEKPPGQRAPSLHLVDILTRSFYMLQRRVVGAILEEFPPEVLLDLEEVRGYGTAQFDRGLEIAQVGYRATQRRREVLEEARRMWFLHRVRAQFRGG